MRIGVVNARRLSDEDRTELGTLAEELAEGEDAAVERIKGKLTRFDEVVGAPDRVEEIADDVVPHFEKRREAMAGGSRPPGLSPIHD